MHQLHVGQVTCLATAAGTGRVLCGTRDNQLQMMQVGRAAMAPVLVPAGEALKGHSDWVHCCAVDGAGGLMASGGRDKTVRVWHNPGGGWIGDSSIGSIVLSGHTDTVDGVSFCPRTSGQGAMSSRMLLSASSDWSLRVWDVGGGGNGTCLQQLRGHSYPVTDVDFEGGGAWAASSGGEDRTCRIWDRATWRCEQTLQVDEVSTCICASPDGRFVLVGTDENVIYVWDARTWKRLITLSAHTEDINCISADTSGRWFASASDDRKVLVWDAQNWRVHCSLPAHKNPVLACVFV